MGLAAISTPIAPQLPVKLAFANILTAFTPAAIGSAVREGSGPQFAVLSAIQSATAAHDFEKDQQPGQGFIKLPDSVNTFVYSGIGKRTTNPGDYVAREHRGQVNLYLRRSPETRAIPVESVHVVVYTKDAYLKDPDGTPEEFERIERARPGYTHVLVALLASSGPKPELSPYRFVHNLAGGNNEALKYSADEIREKAKAILSFENGWITVAD